MRVALPTITVDDDTRRLIAYGLGMEDHLATREEIRQFVLVAFRGELEQQGELRSDSEGF